MSVIAVFTLDDQLLHAAQQQAADQKASGSILQSQDNTNEKIDASQEDLMPLELKPLLGSGEVANRTLSNDGVDRAALPALYWLEKSLKSGIVDSLTKLNPTLAPDAAVHAYHLGLLALDYRFANAITLQAQIEAFSMVGTRVKTGQVIHGGEMARALFGQFGCYCLHLHHHERGRSMAIGLMTKPEVIYAFDASIGLFKVQSPSDLANMLTIWIESKQSVWHGAYYELWRVTL